MKNGSLKKAKKLQKKFKKPLDNGTELYYND